MAERLRNLGKYPPLPTSLLTASTRTYPHLCAIGSLTVVCFYPIVQMVGAGQLIQLLFGLEYNTGRGGRWHPDDGMSPSAA